MTKAFTTFFVVAIWLSIVMYAAHVISENIAETFDNVANQIARQ